MPQTSTPDDTPASATASDLDSPFKDEQSEPAPIEASTPQPVQSPPIQAQSEQIPAPVEPASRNANWLMAQPSDSFTLQLVTLSSAERVQTYLASQDHPEQFASYRLHRGDRILHVVVYGSFATRALAEAESRRLPASVGKVKPWLRSMGAIQSAIRTALQP